MKKIAVLIDFTSVCEVALEHAVVVVRKTLSPLILVNIAPDGQQKNEQAIKQKMMEHTDVLEREGIPYKLKIGYGEFFSTINNYLNEIGIDFVIVGTHGIKGIADVSYGLNIIRLTDSTDMPSLIVQGHSEAPQEGYDNVLIPIVGPDIPVQHIEAIVKLTLHFDAKITVLQFLHDESTSDTQQKFYEDQFKALGISVQYECEEASPYVHSFNKSIMQFADIEEINMVVWTNPPTGDMFDLDDKENLILNRYGISVLFMP